MLVDFKSSGLSQISTGPAEIEEYLTTKEVNDFTDNDDESPVGSQKIFPSFTSTEELNFPFVLPAHNSYLK